MYFRGAALFTAVLALASCAKPPNSYRLAVLRFESFTPNPTADWIGRALSVEIAGQLEGTRHTAIIPFQTLEQIENVSGSRPVSAPGISTGLEASMLAGANRTLTGYYTLQHDRLALTAVESDLDSRKTIFTLSESGALDDLLHLANEIAQDADEEARPPITGSARALRSYAIGLETHSDAANTLFEEAIRFDPDFGKPYVAMARRAIANHNTDAFAQIFGAARQRGSSISPIDRSVLNLEDARLHASLDTRIDALSALVRVMPADPFRLQELAAAELEANRNAEAADHFRRLITLLPTNVEPLNQLGYALLYAGDESGAMKAFESYRRAAPGDANALDSEGDAQFFFGHLNKAEDDYVGAHDRNPGLLDGCELLKAAWARLMRSDQNGAAGLIRRYRSERASLHDPLADFRAAQVLRLAGAKEQAAALVSPYTQSASPVFAKAASDQLAWWRFFDNLGPGPAETSDIERVVAAVVGNNARSVVPVSRKLAETAPPNDWWTRTLYARVLSATGQTEEEKRYLQYNPIPQPTRGLSLDDAWFPWILHAR